MKTDWNHLIDNLFRGDRASLARVITHVENREPGWSDAMKRVSQNISPAHVIGITGSAGVGKSTLTSAVANNLADRGYRIGILAIDPSSPFQGGAFLGDRIRMQSANVRDEIFIRSMATRGETGGLCQAARDVVRLLKASGKTMVLIETVGTGQDEVDIHQIVDCVCLVCAPGLGDGIQALKAGIMEIASVFVVNKADREGSDTLAADILSMQRLSSDSESPAAPLYKTVASTGNGVDELVTGLLDRMNRNSRPDNRGHETVKAEIRYLLEKMSKDFLNRKLDESQILEQMIGHKKPEAVDPYTTAEELFQRIFKHAAAPDH
ncbi:MAG: methylmalonyl Co-A mutase-associated GTPase MeaB [Deltaproteobacteria bacterium]|jgi:LAO/AO transport system kinase|nr:methylmalonyl Co-A mutase-associated GTPase MeaB [Deltaproteobacteria bacterium]MBT4268616.1 methylmalonyl Co-A mutase-associated GTPase MeaB [Deltaproteobacteria bacterium]MBT4642713.1 methylmalonyl Co-A mutase-associated GTPase MeaB [Deltaproteobacteria bacterium]MBT6501983.1 methylmalonyl Co-A mutase-associated GTPase MeaB [Deltaproteobacteria bacterium]MBT7154978.1 methylmalonyl Co-A mutase-associated GTPase MeaB [Deltaproteobacteria bacterium]